MVQEQYIRPLTLEHAAILNGQRAAIADVRRQLVEQGIVPPAIGGIELAQEILNRQLIYKNEFAYQEAIGVVIGDEIARREGYIWLTVSTIGEPGPCICHPQKAVALSPLTAVRKRFQNDDMMFNVAGLLSDLMRQARESLRDPKTPDIDLSQPNGLARRPNGRG